MRLPRRTPWAHISELDEVCRMIYSESSTLETKRKALNRLCAWKCNTALPHALDVTISLLAVTLEDATLLTSPSTSVSALGLRQAYALAIVRLVNSLVDPLQQGAYARPVVAIAAQIGLPAWFVELRHQATHDDLPSLPVLQEAAREALAWLLHNYFVPTITPSTTNRHTTITLSPISPLLAKYKTLLKEASRDATFQRTKVDRMHRELERWIGEAKIASWGFGLAGMEDGDDWKETWALDRLCEGLLDKGGLVPVSKKKRSQPSSKLDLPPNTSVWSPLLLQLQTNHPSFPNQLLTNLLSVFSDSSPGGVSYKWAIAEWIIWTSRQWEAECPPEEVVKVLIATMGKSSIAEDNAIMKVLVKALVSSNAALKQRANMLLTTLDQLSAADIEMTSGPNTLIDEMADRLRQIQEAAPTKEPSLAVPTPEVSMVMDEGEIAPGWSLVDASRWKPCPIGVFQS